ncbi:hypothetical protein ACEZDB_11910 [Streptacidiphilus sp. N1-3]|uniref:Saccharopine dehydrogenase NADP binding domain-containing protein n=1 Tax=Streptacidiphilus alkalitolerans TaxID=3342712 RepID=A0ABV6WZ96_9ACTN
MNEIRKIQVIGAGDIGRQVFQGLALSDASRSVQLVGRDEEATLRAANLTRFSSVQRGHSARVSHAVTDLFDVERTAERIAAFQPDIIFLAASLQSWWVITTLPEQAFQRLYQANYGPWLPMHLVPVMKAMQAVRLADSPAVVVNAAYPDAVHPALTAVGLSPEIGIGNVANNVPGIRVGAADLLGVHPSEVEVRLVAHHYVSHRLSRTGDAGAASMGLAVLHHGRDITAELDIGALLGSLPHRYRRTGGLAGQVMTAASALSVLEPLATGRDALVHAPGPLGLVGGYPVALEGGRIRLELPQGLSADDAVKINESGQLQDGISDIRPDGTVLFEESSMAVLTRELGYDCAEMPLDQAEGRAREITERLAAYRQRVTR